MHEAFDSEWKVVICLGHGQFSSVESVHDLEKKFAQAGVALRSSGRPTHNSIALELLASCRKSKTATIRAKVSAER